VLKKQESGSRNREEKKGTKEKHCWVLHPLSPSTGDLRIEILHAGEDEHINIKLKPFQESENKGLIAEIEPSQKGGSSSFHPVVASTCKAVVTS